MVKVKASEIKQEIYGTDAERQAIEGGIGVGSIFKVVTEVEGANTITAVYEWAGSIGWCKQ